ncbi:hypothetical protein [Romboutsia sp.]|uniref:hypothetical protein n=1 Tax=Romboutsia sp. TaxID=1965302 RepID=UPI003F2BFDC6
MNNDMLQYLVNLAVFIPFVMILIVVSIRFSRGNLEGIGIYKYTKVIERTNLNKDTDVFVLKIGDEGCVIISSPSKIEKIKDLSLEEMKNIEEKRQQIKHKKIINLNKRDINLKNIDLKKLDIKKLDLKKLKLKEKKDGHSN